MIADLMRQIEILQARHKLTKYPAAQAETIARHYVSLAALATNLLRIIEAKRFGATEPVDALIADQIDIIKEAHARDFGIELEWPISHPNTPSSPPTPDEPARESV